MRDVKARAPAPRRAAPPPIPPERLAELQENARHVATLLKALSNPARLIILCQLAEGERSVGELERAVGISQSGISQHLAVLRRLAVVKTRRERQAVIYSLGSEDIAAMMAAMHSIFCRDARRLASA